MAPPRTRDNPLTRSPIGIAGFLFLTLIFLACVLTLPWTLARVAGEGDIRRYADGESNHARLAPVFVTPDADERARRIDIARTALESELSAQGLDAAQIEGRLAAMSDDEFVTRSPKFLLGSDLLGRSMLVRLLTGGGISLAIGVCAALLSVMIGTIYGTIAGYFGGKVDAVMMRIVDILFGLPYILLVVLLAVAVGSLVSRWEAQRADLDTFQRAALQVGTLLVAIGGVSWLTMSRVVRGQVLSLKNQPFMEAARAIGTPLPRQFRQHLLPNLVGPIVVYATLTVPQAILQESFLSFLGIGVSPPLPSWGNLAAEGLTELNQHRSHWWMLLFPCLLLGLTLLSLNFVGEGLREAIDPKRSKR